MAIDIPVLPGLRNGAVFSDIVTRRKSVRQLQAGELDEVALHRILDAARRTPSAYNQPPWQVVLINKRSTAFWDVVEAAFRQHLDGERLERYLSRLDGFRHGLGAVLVYEDRQVVDGLQTQFNLDASTAQSFSHQAIGMVQLSLWLAIVAEGLATSLQHWEAQIEASVADFLGLPAERYRLITTMPIGYAVEEPELSAPRPHFPGISLDTYQEGGFLATIEF